VVAKTAGFFCFTPLFYDFRPVLRGKNSDLRGKVPFFEKFHGLNFYNVQYFHRFGLRKNWEVLVSADNFAKLGMQKLTKTGNRANEP
jgi:hypothetical protein